MNEDNMIGLKRPQSYCLEIYGLPMNYKNVNYNNTLYVPNSSQCKTQDLSKKLQLDVRTNSAQGEIILLEVLNE